MRTVSVAVPMDMIKSDRISGCNIRYLSCQIPDIKKAGLSGRMSGASLINRYRYRSIQILFRNTEKTRSTSLTEHYLNIIFFLYKAVEKGRGTVVAAGSSDAMFGGGDSADDDEEVRSL